MNEAVVALIKWEMATLLAAKTGRNKMTDEELRSRFAYTLGMLVPLCVEILARHEILKDFSDRGVPPVHFEKLHAQVSIIAAAFYTERNHNDDDDKQKFQPEMPRLR